MSRAIQKAALLILLIALAVGCADDTKYQYGFRGKWRLESRTLPDGKVLEPPSVTGHYEWYPTSKTSAHVTASFASGRDKIQLSGFTYKFEDPLFESQDFSREDYLNIGGGYTLAYQPVYTTPNTSTTGKISRSGNEVAFESADGSIQVHADVSITVIEDATFTVTYSDGTVDKWRRFVDQRGALPK